MTDVLRRMLGNGSTNWCSLSADANPIVTGEGSGSIDEMQRVFRPDVVCAAILRMDFSATLTKYVYIWWSGSDVSVVKRGRMTARQEKVRTKVRDDCPIHCSIEATDRDETSPENLITTLKSVVTASAEMAGMTKEAWEEERERQRREKDQLRRARQDRIETGRQGRNEAQTGLLRQKLELEQRLAELESQDHFLQKLQSQNAQTGQITCSLIWESTDDLDLHCTAPDGTHIDFSNKKGGGGNLDVDMNAGSRPKAVLFVLDCSGSMSGSRLNSCKQALEAIYNDNLSNTDQLALVTFASDVRNDLGWTMKAGSEGRVPQLFRSLTTRGSTQMFAGIQRAIDMTKQDGGMAAFDNWIVLLCDGAITIVSVCLSVCLSECVSPAADAADDFCVCVVHVM
jgi:Mg-chelatase subunit ChlD